LLPKLTIVNRAAGLRIVYDWNKKFMAESGEFKGKEKPHFNGEMGV
jgi:hypothetical protein